MEKVVLPLVELTDAANDVKAIMREQKVSAVVYRKDGKYRLLHAAEVFLAHRNLHGALDNPLRVSDLAGSTITDIEIKPEGKRIGLSSVKHKLVMLAEGPSDCYCTHGHRVRGGQDGHACPDGDGGKVHCG